MTSAVSSAVSSAGGDSDRVPPVLVWRDGGWVIVDVLSLLVVPAFLVVLAAAVLWCAGRDLRRDRARRPRRGRKLVVTR